MKPYLYYSILCLLTTVALSCSKKRGCNDTDACNFDATAEKYDGSCTYEETWYADPDGDGYGDPSFTLTQCEQPNGYVNNANGIGTPAVDFTVMDCAGATHNLFNELDNNKIIVIAWVMPCSTCITDPLAASNIVNNYASSHPGRVKFYLVDDYANTPCNGLDGWALAYGFSNITTFSHSDISMSGYGVDGMPKIVVLGGSNHRVYYNENESSIGVNAAIVQALTDNP